MSSIAVVAWTIQNRVAKYAEYETEAEADAHVLRVNAMFPDAFVAPHPGGGAGAWLIDPVAKTVSVVPLPPPVQPTNDEIYDQVIQTQTVLKAIVLALNDGSLVPGANEPGSTLKTIIKAKM